MVAAGPMRYAGGPARRRKRGTPAGQVLIVGVSAFMIWTILCAPGLKRAAEASPLGVRRTVSIAVLTPFARLSALLGLDRPGKAVDRALGREPQAPIFGGTGPIIVDEPTPPEPTVSPSPTSPGATPSPGATETPAEPVVLGPLRAPTEDDPLGVMISGDSLGEGMSWGLSRILTDSGLAVPSIHTKISSGLSRPDFFDWPRAIRGLVDQEKPDLVVLMLGANDAQGMLVDGHAVECCTKEWQAEYRNRVERVMTEVTSSGKHRLVWVGLPIMGQARLYDAARIMNAIYEAEAAEHPGVTYVDAWSLFQNKKGEYAAYLPNEEGEQELVRTPDGVHFTLDGSTRLGEAIWDTIQTLWKTPPPAETTAPAGTPSSSVQP